MSFVLTFPIVFPGIDDVNPAPIPSPPTPVDLIDHAETVIKRLAEYLKNKTNVYALLGITADQSNDLENAFQELLTERGIDNAQGAVLDNLGAIVKEPRNGQSDDFYRIFIRARIKLNKTSGTAEDIFSTFSDIIPTGATMRIVDQGPAEFIFSIETKAVTADLAAIFADFFRNARAAGVYGQFKWAEQDAGNVFTFDSGPGFDVGHLAGITV